MAVVLASTAFRNGEPIPQKYAGEGEDVSPPVSWSGLPEAAAELVLICDDLDALTPEPWVHWLIYKIPADVTGLPENLPKRRHLKYPPGALQGRNSWPTGETIGYRGPLPPPGHRTHHYRFTLYALDVRLPVEAGRNRKFLLEMMAGHVLGSGELIGTYRRPLPTPPDPKTFAAWRRGWTRHGLGGWLMRRRKG
jgi:Raf kinase inhibitor-like YbhB/YbcL family protein